MAKLDDMTNDELVEAATKKIDKILINWYMNDTDVVMLSVFYMIQKRADQTQETLGINTTAKAPCITFNPKFVLTISEERLELIMAIEGYKILLRHVTTRLKEPKSISALSSSITINQLLMSSIKQLLAGLDECTPSPEQYGLKPDKFYEEYYRNLMERVNQIQQMIQQIWGSMSQEQKQEMIDKSQQGQGQGEQDEGQPQDGEGQSGEGQEQKEGEGQGQQFKDFKNQNDAIKEYFNPNGTSNKDWGANDMFDAEVKETVERKKDSPRNWGKFTGSAQQEIMAANTPKISYKEVLRRFGRSLISPFVTTSRMKINRRYDTSLPGYRRSFKASILFAIDASGSMGDDDISEGFAVVNSCMKYAEVEYLLWDTDVKLHETKLKKAKKSFKVTGRGGTDPLCVFNWMEKQKKKYDGVVMYTDGGFCHISIPEPTKYKTLWLLYKEGADAPCPWGFKAYLKRYEDTHTF